MRPCCIYKSLNPSGHYMYYQFKFKEIILSVHMACLCVLCGSQNKQQLFPYIILLTGLYV
jgi:hypothetical protein